MRLRDSPTEILAEVSDDGPGIPPQERERVFRRFYRLEHSRTTPGNGLGLSLVAAIAELHHATIDLLDNKPGLIVLIRFPKTMLTVQCFPGSVRRLNPVPILINSSDIIAWIDGFRAIATKRTIRRSLEEQLR